MTQHAQMSQAINAEKVVYFGWTTPHKAPLGSFVPDKD